METITVLAVAKASRQYNQETIWGVKVREDGTKLGVWYNLYTEPRPTKGQVFTVGITDTQRENGRVFHDARIVGAQPSAPTQPAQPTTTQPRQSNGPNRTTPYTASIADWEVLIDRGFAMADKHGLKDDAARVSLVAIFAIPFGDGKLSMENWQLEEIENWGTVLHAETAFHVELENLIHESGMNLTEIVGRPTSNARELSCADAQTALVKLDRKIAQSKDWKLDLAAGIQKYCTDNKLDFGKEKFNVLLSVAGTRDLKTLAAYDAYAAHKKIAMLPKLNPDDIPPF